MRLEVLRRHAPVPLAVRGVALVAGAVALGVAPGGELLVSGLIAGTGGLGLLVAVLRPDSGGSTVVLGCAAAAWIVRYGSGEPPLAATLVLAGALAVHHQAAALAAALPPSARVEPAVLVRFGRHAMVVLGVSAAVAGVALLAGRPGGSVPLELAGLVAVALVTAVPIWLARRL